MERLWQNSSRKSFSSPYFPAFELNTEIYRVNICIDSWCVKIRTRKALNKDTFQEVTPIWHARVMDVILVLVSYSLCKISYFHQISQCGKWAFLQNFYTRKLGEIPVFYAVIVVKFTTWLLRNFKRPKIEQHYNQLWELVSDVLLVMKKSCSSLFSNSKRVLL